LPADRQASFAHAAINDALAGDIAGLARAPKVDAANFARYRDRAKTTLDGYGKID